jgi:hypothetical protein
MSFARFFNDPDARHNFKTSGNKLTARVKEVTPLVILYQTIDSLQGPILSVTKADVFII